MNLLRNVKEGGSFTFGWLFVLPKENVPHGGEVSVQLLNIFLLFIFTFYCRFVVSANGICLGKVRAFKVTQFSDSSKDDERKKAQKATKPAFGLGNVSTRQYEKSIVLILT